MLHTYTATYGDTTYEVTFTCSPAMEDAEVEEITLGGLKLDFTDVYIKVPHVHTSTSEFFPRVEGYKFDLLEIHLLEQALTLLAEDGGALHQDKIAAAEHRTDCEREE